MVFVRIKTKSVCPVRKMSLSPCLPGGEYQRLDCFSEIIAMPNSLEVSSGT